MSRTVEAADTEFIMTAGGSRLQVGGKDVFVGDIAAAAAAVCDLAGAGGRHLVVTPNVDHIVKIMRDRANRAWFESAAIRLLDGMPLVALAHRLGADSARRCTGADLLPQVAAAAAPRELRVALTGGDDDISEAAAARLRRDNPGAEIHSVPMPRLDRVSDLQSLHVVERLHALRPHVVFIGMGCPKQEHWYMHWREDLPDAVYVGSGAAAEYAAGARTRPPALMRNLGFEWLGRLAQEPRRLARRYLIDSARFLPFAIASLRRREDSLPDPRA